MGRIKNFIRNLNYLSKHSLWDQREEDIVYLTNKILDDGIYEYGIRPEGYKFLNILDTWKSIEYIAETNKSFVRFNDGEVRLMRGMDQPFQAYDKELVSRLYKILSDPDPNVVAGINKNYYIPLYNVVHNDYDRRNAYDLRWFFLENCDANAVYLDGTLTFWNFGEHSEESEKFWKAWKEMFRGKRIAIICGRGILDKLDYDVFELSDRREYIYGPSRHAWIEYERIMSDIVKNVSKDTLLIFILGMAGKAMIPEMSALGYVAWDIGHLAKSYDAYMKNTEYTEENVADFYAPD